MMRRIMSATIAATLAGGAGAQFAAPFEVGEPFPAVVLPAAEGGEPMSIADFRGKKIVLHMFASW